MKFECEKSSLAEAIAGVSRAVTMRSSVPALEGILFKAEGNTLTLTGYDLEMGITTKIDARIRDEGAVVLSAKLVGDMVRRLPAELVEIELSLIHICVKGLPPLLPGRLFGALFQKLRLHAQLPAGPAQKIQPLAGGLQQRQLQPGAIDLCHHPGKARPGAHVHQTALHLRLGRQQQGIDKMLFLDPLRVGDRGQVDLFIVFHQQCGVPVQQGGLRFRHRHFAAGGLCGKTFCVDHALFPFPSRARRAASSTESTAISEGLTPGMRAA